jgi:hypothetical protein
MRHRMMRENSTQLSEPFAMCAGAHTATPCCSATDGMRGEVDAHEALKSGNSTFGKPSPNIQNDDNSTIMKRHIMQLF